MRRILSFVLPAALLAGAALAGEPAPGTGEVPSPASGKADDLAALMEYHAEAGRYPEAVAKGRDAARLLAGLGDRRAAGRLLSRTASLALKGGMPDEARRDLFGRLRHLEPPRPARPGRAEAPGGGPRDP
ncbi:MAG: hypothetical protein MUC63_03440 [Planctomycetes bacterium]|nr:hypothetical protein [Planctomycetota bacterium]